MILTIVILGFLLRVIALNQSVWIDEATSILTAGNFAFWDIITKFAPGDFHPPFYYLVLKVWVGVFGSTEIGARTLSVLAGILTILVVYKIGREIYGEKAGKVAALLLAVAPLHIYYSQEARMYSLAALFVAVAVFSFMKTLKSKRVGWWIVFTLAIIMAVGTDYLPALILPVFWLVKRTKQLFMSHIILAGLTVLWLPTLMRQLASGLSVASSSPSWWNALGTGSIKNLALIPVKFMVGRISFDDKYLYAFIVVGASLLFGYLLTKAKSAKLMWLWLIVPLALGALLSLKIPVFSYFRFLFVLPAFYLLMASSQKRFLLAAAVLVNLAASGYYLLNPKFHREDWKSLTAHVEGKKPKDAITLFVADSQMEAYKYYYPNAKVAGPEGFDKNSHDIWLIRYVQPMFDPKDNLRGEIEKNGFKKAGEYDFNGVVVWNYLK